MAKWWTKYRKYHSKHPFEMSGLPERASKETKEWHATMLPVIIDQLNADHLEFIDRARLQYS